VYDDDRFFLFQPILLGNYPFLRQKICLMALIESVFARGAYDRTMSFQTISEETRLPLDEVEHLIMKALRCLLFNCSAISDVTILTKEGPI
jgi:26S proteasome regulatory subunit N9